MFCRGDGDVVDTLPFIGKLSMCIAHIKDENSIARCSLSSARYHKDLGFEAGRNSHVVKKTCSIANCINIPLRVIFTLVSFSVTE